MYDYTAEGYEQEPEMFDPNAPLQQATKKRKSIQDVLIDLAPLGSEEEAIQRQRAYADELRGTPMQDLRHAGRVVVAADPLEGLNTMVNRAGGAQMRTKSIEDQKALAERMRQIIMEGMNQ